MIGRATVWVLAAAVLEAGCGGGAPEEAESAPVSAAASSELTAAQLENGIGPITSIELPAHIDGELAEQGEQIFQTKCMACHRLDERYVGPPLRDVLGRRTPEYAMNMMLNSTEMVQKHPVAKELLAQFFTPMPSQNLTEADARALVEYLRLMRAAGPGHENVESAEHAVGVETK